MLRAALYNALYSNFRGKDKPHLSLVHITFLDSASAISRKRFASLAHPLFPSCHAQIINETLDGLIAKCKALVEEEDAVFGEDFLSERDPSILHFLLASGGRAAPRRTPAAAAAAASCDVFCSAYCGAVQGQQGATQPLAGACNHKHVASCTLVLMRRALMVAGDEISSKQLRDDLMTMLIAGHETTAAVLTWTMYLLAQHPEAVERIRAEVGRAGRLSSIAQQHSS
jgi:hypothetical protein